METAERDATKALPVVRGSIQSVLIRLVQEALIGLEVESSSVSPTMAPVTSMACIIIGSARVALLRSLYPVKGTM
jgi:hypothetical protein